MSRATPILALVAVGRAIADGRARVGWSQRELARRSGVVQSRISLIERGRAAGVSVRLIDRVFVALGIRYHLEFDLPAVQPIQRDRVHAWAIGSLRRRLQREGFVVAVEVEVGGDRSRGWIDALAYRPSDRVLLIGEFKSVAPDIGAIERQVGWYEREAIAVAARRGWRPSRVVSVLFLLATTENDNRVADNAAVLGDSFPGRARDLQPVFNGERPAHRRYLVMVDPGSRSRTWVLPTRVDRRRRDAPYRDYLAAARHAPSTTRDASQRSAGQRPRSTDLRKRSAGRVAAPDPR